MNFREFLFRNRMKSPEKDLTGTLPSAENGSTGLHFGVSHCRGTSIKGPPTTFHTVSPRSTLAITPRNVPRRLERSTKALEVFSCRFAATTRKKRSPIKKGPAAQGYWHRLFEKVGRGSQKPHIIMVGRGRYLDHRFWRIRLRSVSFPLARKWLKSRCRIRRIYNG